MTAGIIEAGAGSLSGSVLGYFLIRLWKKYRRQIKVRGLLVNDDSNWEKLENFSNEDILFINLKKGLAKNYPQDLIRADVRLKVFPKAKEYIEKLKDEFRKKTFVLVSDDLEMLKYLGLKNKFIKSILPSEPLIEQLSKTSKTDYNRIKLEVLSILDKKNIHIVDNNEDLIAKIRDLYNVMVK